MLPIADANAFTTSTTPNATPKLSLEIVSGILAISKVGVIARQNEMRSNDTTGVIGVKRSKLYARILVQDDNSINGIRPPTQSTSKPTKGANMTREWDKLLINPDLTIE